MCWHVLNASFRPHSTQCLRSCLHLTTANDNSEVECCVPLCFNNTREDAEKELKFYTFPKDDGKRRAWTLEHSVMLCDVMLAFGVLFLESVKFYFLFGVLASIVETQGYAACFTASEFSFAGVRCKQLLRYCVEYGGKLALRTCQHIKTKV